ncbi:FecCD family ABC transporter permease [Staphylococcus pettenkoferi]|mgnify:CR=1 FL=1|uniref:FecCD family ABC transporter permease n=1 Tax=Staphylococcus pettenkoferi TaxID=170573 RepID=UPI0011A7E91F|nr:iron ABC transporter permease [Staphylococcus pettenkoferi]MCY1627211.1 iron ABC transporter permease [Staphylococcus pettenkoferi]
MSQAKSVLIWLIVLIISMSLGLLWDIGNLQEQLSQSILFQVRIPKVLEAALAGAGLTLAGLIFQTLLNNPLADSFTLGLASGATFGSGVAVALGLSFLLIPVSSILFSLITLALVLLMTRLMSRGHPIRTLILSGIMIGALFNAFLYVIIVLNQRKMNSIVNYMFGGFSDAEYTKMSYIACALVIGLLVLFIMLPQLKLLQLDERQAVSLGLRYQTVTYVALIIASVITAIIVAYVGIIGFIGMVIPQLVRRIYRTSQLGTQMILNCLIGASVMVLADWLGTTVIYPIQIPASIVLALFSIPVLFFLLISEHKYTDSHV